MIGLKQAAIAVSALSPCSYVLSLRSSIGNACGGWLPSWRAGIPRSRLSFPTGKVCCHLFASFWIIWRQIFRAVRLDP